MPTPGSRSRTYKDADTGQVFDRQVLDTELSKTEKPAGIANPKDFRNEIVKFALRARASNQGKNPVLDRYEKIREVIEKRMFSQVEDLLPIISFGAKQDTKTEKQHADFLERMMARGYTERQVRRLVEWYMRVNKAGRRRAGSGHGSLHRSPPQSARQEPRQPPALPSPHARADQDARSTRRCAERGHRRRRQGRRGFDPADGIGEPHFHLSDNGGERECVLPGNKEFVAGDQIEKPKGGGAGGSGRRRVRLRRGRGRFRVRADARTNSSTSSSRTSSCPISSSLA